MRNNFGNNSNSGNMTFEPNNIKSFHQVNNNVNPTHYDPSAYGTAANNEAMSVR